MLSLPAPYTVDTTALQAALAALADVGSAMTQVRIDLRTVLADGPLWAADGDLPSRLQDLVDTLDAAARRGQVDGIALAEAVRSAARGYTDVEQAAIAGS